MKKVFIGVGHGGTDGGAAKYLIEKNINLKMALACRDYLEKLDIMVLMSRTIDEDEALDDKIKECNSYKPDVALDIHNNAGGGEGFEIFHTTYGGVGKSLAENIEKEVINIGQVSRGLKVRIGDDGRDYFAFIRETNCPSVICEGVFVDNENDAVKADTDEECKQFGIAYAKGILRTLGLNDYYVDNNISSNTKLYKVQVGAFENKENAQKLVNELSMKGYKAIIKY